MAYEKRHNRSYYYRKTRDGDRVSSYYLGSGPWVEDFLTRRERSRQAERRLRHHLDDLDAHLKSVYTLIHTFRQVILLLSGHHTHKGQWRKKRDPPDP